MSVGLRAGYSGTMLSVVTFLWDNPEYRWRRMFEYTPGHVDKLARAVRRHLTMPYRFLCVTDYPGQSFKEVDGIVPLWSDYRSLGGCYVRLKAFSEEMREILGERFVWFDVDVLITGNLDPLLSRTEDFMAWKDVNPPTPYCGSMVMMDAGARKEVWEDFDPEVSPNLAGDKGYIGTDQAWMGYRLGLDEKTWSAEDGVYSYKKGTRGGALPENARVIVFHGPYDPSQEEEQKLSPWIKDHWV